MDRLGAAKGARAALPVDRALCETGDYVTANGAGSAMAQADEDCANLVSDTDPDHPSAERPAPGLSTLG